MLVYMAIAPLFYNTLRKYVCIYVYIVPKIVIYTFVD
jgi:hypothetical protein